MKSNQKENILDQIPSCVIDPHGVFKYIQISVVDSNNENNSKIVVRGYTKYTFHVDNYGDFQQEITELDLDKLVEYNCLGGGRININEKNKTIKVYGYSKNFGLCDHQISCNIIRGTFPNYTISWTNEGY
jgi:phosphohistidine phosphatase